MFEICFKCILICKMNAVVLLALACVSIARVKAIKRIPVNIFYRGNANKQHSPEDLPETDDTEDEETLNVIDGDDNKNAVGSDKSINGNLKFTDFILEAAKVLKTYENYDLEQAFVMIDYEVWENMYKGCKSHELADIRRYVFDQLGLLKDDPADTLRQYLDYIIDIITNEDYRQVGDLVDFVNSLYAGKHEKFIEVLLALVHKRISADVNLANLIKYALNTLIFDHYCNLDNTVRQELIKKIKHYWNQFTPQIVNYKMGRGISTLPLVTPFIYEKRNKQINKKRRFNTVHEGRSLIIEDSEYSEENTSEMKMRADSTDISHTHRPRPCPGTPGSTTCHKPQAKNISSESTKEDSNKNDLVIINNTAIVNGGSEILKTTTIDEMKGNIFRVSPTPEPEESMNDVLSSNTRLVSRNSNKTIEKLIKIGTLAKEINDMIALKGKIMRNNQNAQSLDSMLGMHISELLGDNGAIAITPDMLKADEGNGKKDILISMKARYQE